VPADERPAVADSIQSLADNVIVGDPGILVSLGSIAWITAVISAATAYRHVGAGLLASILLALSFIVVSHPPPIGPVGLVFFAVAVALLASQSARQPVASPPPTPAAA
jgi:hypothetical protein